MFIPNPRIAMAMQVPVPISRVGATRIRSVPVPRIQVLIQSMPSRELRCHVLCYLVKVQQSHRAGSRLAICEMPAVTTERKTRQLIQRSQRAVRTISPTSTLVPT